MVTNKKSVTFNVELVFDLRRPKRRTRTRDDVCEHVCEVL